MRKKFNLIFITGTEKTNKEQQMNEDYREENFSNHVNQKQFLFPFSSQFMKDSGDFPERDSGVPSVRNHRLQIRDGTLKFRLNDGSLRIGRGFGKRTYGTDPYVDK